MSAPVESEARTSTTSNAKVCSLSRTSGTRFRNAAAAEIRRGLTISARSASPGYDLAVIDDGDTLAQLVRLFHVVRGQHDGLAEAVVVANDLPQQEARLRIEARGGLVEEDSTCGSCIMARAIDSRCIMPPEKPRTIGRRGRSA